MRKWGKPLCFLLCLLVFIVIAVNLDTDGLQDFDLRITRELAQARTPLVTAIMTGFTSLCGPVTLLIICLALMVLIRRKHYSIPIAVNLMMSVFLNFSLKSFFVRARPPIEFRAIAETGFSFPSGHTMAATAFYGFLIYLVWQSDMRKAAKNALTALLSLLIAGVGFSRIYLGVHYCTDVLAGLAVAAGYLLIYTSIVGFYLRAGEVVEPDGSVKNDRLCYSFLHAFEGIASGLKSERNMMIHFAAMALVTVCGFLFSISSTEWMICVTLFGLVIAAELINTAIETTVNICMPHIDPRAKLAKDTAAGAVLAVCIGAAIAGAIIFVPKIISSIMANL